jgi:hypothetical protein
MENFKLHYAKLDLESKDIELLSFKKHNDLIDFIDENCINRSKQVVWLIAKDESNDIFISDSHLSIQDFLSKKYLWQIPDTYYLQEYSSFEDAYSVALSMLETSDLCYNQ